jgi:hypothetical protein
MQKLREDIQRLEEVKATHAGMVESCDELLMEIARETGLDCMGEDEDDEEEGEDAAAPLLPHHHLQCPLLPCLRRSMKTALWRRSLSKKPRCHMRSSWQMLSPRCHSSVSTMHS